MFNPIEFGDDHVVAHREAILWQHVPQTRDNVLEKKLWKFCLILGTRGKKGKKTY